MQSYPDNLQFFLDTFLYQLESLLNQELSYFDDLEFQLDEANTDQALKSRLRTFILEHLQGFTIEPLSLIDIKTPSELTTEDKNQLRAINNATNYTNPDLLCFITDSDRHYFVPIEIKSTKNDAIPGSSIQQINANPWVIFLRHDDQHVINFVAGRYVNAINGRVQFPGRSPRPTVSYQNLKNWNDAHRKIVNGVLTFTPDPEENQRLEFLKDWQMFLAQRWLATLNQTAKANSEPWFNNNLRKFAAALLDHYNSLDDEQKVSYLKFIKDNTK